jgi:hypothetical protein
MRLPNPREIFPIEADLARDGPKIRMARPIPRKTKAKLIRFWEPTTFFFISAKHAFVSRFNPQIT